MYAIPNFTYNNPFSRYFNSCMCIICVMTRYDYENTGNAILKNTILLSASSSFHAVAIYIIAWLFIHIPMYRFLARVRRYMRVVTKLLGLYLLLLPH